MRYENLIYFLFISLLLNTSSSIANDAMLEKKINTAISFLEKSIENPETLAIDDDFTKVNANIVTIRFSFIDKLGNYSIYIVDIIVHIREYESDWG